MARRRRRMLTASVLASLLVLTGCGMFADTTFLRSDPSLRSMIAMVQYTVNATPDGSSETNQATYQGLGTESPFPMLTTNFGKGANTRTQTVYATAADGTQRVVLGMSKPGLSFGVQRGMEVDVATYKLLDSKGQRRCGAKVRMKYQPSLISNEFLEDKGRIWDALWYYTVPCPNLIGDPDDVANSPLDISGAKLKALVINESFNIHISGQAVLFKKGNRGHSVTVVDGDPARYPGGWWENNRNLLAAAKLIRAMTKDLDQHKWLSFTPGKFNNPGLIYSAGDADVYDLRRIFLNRQRNYVVNFRPHRSAPWKQIVVEPKYNMEWNDLAQNWKAVRGQAFPNIDEKIDEETGLPEDPNDSELREVEKAGCQNCPNVTLEQILFRDGQSGRPLYAMTIRGYVGAESSLVMFGQPPRIHVETALNQADALKGDDGFTDCPRVYNEDGDVSEELSDENCAHLLREGSLWKMLTDDPNKFGFDLVSQYRVRDETTWVSDCDEYGCSYSATDRKLDANYKFNRTDQGLTDAYTVMQLLGEVGVRTLGLSYASGVYSGSGLLFAMQQPMMFQIYRNGIKPGDDESVFTFDSRALQLPNTLAAAGKIIYPAG